MEEHMAVTTHCISVLPDELDSNLLDLVWGIFIRYYVGVKREVFEEDLLSKNQVLLLYESDRLVGFTSQLYKEVGGCCVLYSGDVIIEKSSRGLGTASFFNCWAKLVWNKVDWWCYLSSGPRTYRIPFTFYKRITPSNLVNETEEERNLRHLFAEHLYGQCYCKKSGVVQLKHPYVQTPDDKEVRQDYPYYHFFKRSNPMWHRGDELVSLISLKEENWRPLAIRILKWNHESS